MYQNQVNEEEVLEVKPDHYFRNLFGWIFTIIAAIGMFSILALSVIQVIYWIVTYTHCVLTMGPSESC